MAENRMNGNALKFPQANALSPENSNPLATSQAQSTGLTSPIDPQMMQVMIEDMKAQTQLKLAKAMALMSQGQLAKRLSALMNSGNNELLRSLTSRPGTSFEDDSFVEIIFEE
ncbi:MAG: hypothetical protein JWP89_2661 [Schlesneria sp.]|nr:hypothetical protein [Schlesneria sp.]